MRRAAADRYSGAVNTTGGVSFGYDSVFNRLTSMADATGTTSFSYKPIVTGTTGSGLLASVTGPLANSTISYTYDALERVVARNIADSGTANGVNVAYDSLGRIQSMIDLSGSYGYGYDGVSNRLTSLTYPDGQQAQLSYLGSSGARRLQQIKNLDPSSSVLSQFTYGYALAGDITSWTQQADNNTPVVYGYGYDGADQLLSAVASISGTQSPIDAYAYLYDAAGNRTSQQINNSVMTSVYNSLNQVTSQSGGGMLTISGSLSQPGTVVVGGGQPYVTGTSTYNFSARVPVVAGSNSIQISATNVNSLGVTKTLTLTATNGTAIPNLTYDLNGNLTYDGTFNYGWDSANRLVAIWYGAIGTSGSTTMAYDGLGRRVQIVESSSNGTVTSTKNLVWDGMTICEEKNASDTVTKSYFKEGVQMSGSNYYYTRDQLGSIREVTGTNGVVVAEYSYDPYGVQTETSGTMAFDFGFAGQYYHQTSGLLLAPYREYSASLGRWISRDPLTSGIAFLGFTPSLLKPRLIIGERSLGANRYNYVSNQPIEEVDPLGLAMIYPGPPSNYLYVCSGYNSDGGLLWSSKASSPTECDKKAKNCCNDALSTYNKAMELARVADAFYGDIASRVIAAEAGALAAETFTSCMSK